MLHIFLHTFWRKWFIIERTNGTRRAGTHHTAARGSEKIGDAQEAGWRRASVCAHGNGYTGLGIQPLERRKVVTRELPVRRAPSGGARSVRLEVARGGDVFLCTYLLTSRK